MLRRFEETCLRENATLTATTMAATTSAASTASTRNPTTDERTRNTINTPTAMAPTFNQRMPILPPIGAVVTRQSGARFTAARGGRRQRIWAEGTQGPALPDGFLQRDRVGGARRGQWNWAAGA